MSNIININGEYVKFYYTTNSNLPKILKNTGSVIVLNKSGEDYSYNEIWLADNFIGTGYGLATDHIRSVMNQYGNSYIVEDSETEFTSYLDYRFDDVYNAYSYSLSYAFDLYNNITENFVANQGNASNSYITVGDKQVPLSFLPYFTHFAEYKDAEPLATYINFKGLYNWNNNTIQLENIIDNDKMDLNQTKNSLYYLPIGTIIKKINLKSYINVNDVDISNSKITNTYISNIVSSETEIYDEYSTNEYDYNTVHSDQLENYDDYTNVHVVNIELDNNININEGLQKIISSQIKYNGTTSYYNYPLLEEKTGICIESNENAIKPNEYNLGNVYVQGCFELTYLKYNGGKTMHKDLHPNYNFNNIVNNNYSSSLIINNQTQITVDCPGYCYIGIPINYSVSSAEYLVNSKFNNQNDRHESYINCTGEMYKDSYNDPTPTNEEIFCHFAYKGTVENNTNNNKYIQYNHYRLYIPETGSTTIYFKLYREDNNAIISPINSNNSNINTNELIQSYINITKNYVQNELYNNTHWLNKYDLTYVYRNQ